MVPLSESNIQDLQNLSDDMPPEYNMNIKEIVEFNGFQFEEHKVTTKDGYILTVHRIKAPTTKKGAPVVFFQHGMSNNSYDWVVHTKDKAPALRLAAEGYDVWLGNNRGNQFSRGHKTLNPEKEADKKEYFNYDFEELGKYDLPAQIDLVRDITGKNKVTYVGHSQGTTQMFYALATNEAELKNKINLFVALSPVVRLGSDDSMKGAWLADQARYAMEDLIDATGGYEFGGFDSKVEKKSEWDFDWDAWFASSSSYDDPTRSLIFNRHGDVLSWKEMAHYGQIGQDQAFELFDYREDGNMKRYG
jgi:pimeloyl-ACP methyl ester carboxylesterase